MSFLGDTQATDGSSLARGIGPASVLRTRRDMRFSVITFVFLMGTVPSVAQALEPTPELLRETQRQSLSGLVAVHLRSLGLTAELSSDEALGILGKEIASPELGLASSFQGMTGEAPLLRLAYDMKPETLDGRQVFVYWVALDLFQEVFWAWETNPPGRDGGLAPTWNAFHTGVASSPQSAALGIQQHIRELGRQFAADFRATIPGFPDPMWFADVIIIDPDGTMRCVENYVPARPARPTRTPKPAPRIRLQTDIDPWSAYPWSAYQ